MTMSEQGEPPPAPSRQCGDRIFLIGPRGSGKTTIACALASQLGWSWVDADAELERAAGRSIREVFAAEGESVFREHEAAVLRELAERSRCVVATGGGVVLRADNREVLRRGWVVWLNADADSLWQRLQGDDCTTRQRPALTALPPLEEIIEVLCVREPLYAACADHRVETAGRDVDAIIVEIMTILRRRDAVAPEGEHRTC
jgi:shikimate kinase